MIEPPVEKQNEILPDGVPSAARSILEIIPRRNEKSQLSAWLCTKHLAHPAMPELTTEHVIYTGRVQGVGFRYTVRSLARRHPIRGYVRNLADGTVELVAQGTAGAINALLADVAGAFGDNIDRCQRRPLAGAAAFEQFEIRF